MLVRILKILFLLFWMILIFYFSTDNGVESTIKSDGIVIRISEFVLRRKLTISEKQIYIDHYQVLVRKTAHFTLYFFLGLSFIWVLQDFHFLQRRDVIISILFVFLYACSDEFHQLFIQDRSGQFLDVLIDTLGGITAILIFYGICSHRKKIQN